MSNLTTLATRHTGRPLLLAPRAALDLAHRIQQIDGRSVAREGRFRALIRKLSGGRPAPVAMEDEDDVPPSFGEMAAYSPRYVGEVDDVGFCWSLKDGVALINIDKPLMDRGEVICGEVYHGYDTILAALREASVDDRVRGLFVRSASPGGVVDGGLPALAEWMRTNGARGGGKPIHVHADMACSAAYWLASSADRITAPRVGLIGSIGAVIVHENWSKALAEIGVEITAIQFGASKTDGAWWAALSEQAREDLQAEIDQIGRDFVADVVAGRPQLSAETVLGTEARVFLGRHDDTARSALDLGLVDEISTEEAAFVALRDQVAANLSSPATGTMSAQAPRGRASGDQTKEADMAKTTRPGAKSPTLNAARSALAKAKADLIRAAAAEADAAEDDDMDPDGEDDAADPADAGGYGDEPEAEGGEDDAGAGEDSKASEASRIAGSPEAKSHPQLALAAINTGQTYAQFKANVAHAGGQNRLASTLAAAGRVGPDATAPKGAAARLDPKAIYARRNGGARAGA
jgi:ClpP class serine protease